MQVRNGRRREPKGGAIGRATWQSWLISDPGAKNFVKTERDKQRRRIWVDSAHGLSMGVCGFLAGYAGRLSACANRAALRAAQRFAPSLPAQPTRNHKHLWGNLIVVHEKER